MPPRFRSLRRLFLLRVDFGRFFLRTFREDDFPLFFLVDFVVLGDEFAAWFDVSAGSGALDCFEADVEAGACSDAFVFCGAFFFAEEERLLGLLEDLPFLRLFLLLLLLLVDRPVLIVAFDCSVDATTVFVVWATKACALSVFSSFEGLGAVLCLIIIGATWTADVLLGFSVKLLFLRFSSTLASTSKVSLFGLTPTVPARFFN